MPRKLAGWANRPLRVVRMRWAMLSALVTTIQAASNRLKATRGFHSPPSNGAVNPTRAAVTNAQRSSRASSGMLACFQRAKGATPIRNRAGNISGANTESK